MVSGFTPKFHLGLHKASCRQRIAVQSSRTELRFDSGHRLGGSDDCAYGRPERPHRTESALSPSPPADGPARGKTAPSRLRRQLSECRWTCLLALLPFSCFATTLPRYGRVRPEECVKMRRSTRRICTRQRQGAAHT